MILIVHDSTLLFGLVNLQNHVISLANQSWWYSVLSVASCVPVFTLTPRFILSVRALYARDQGNRGTSTCGIDSAFGLSSTVSNLGGIAFADAWLEDEIPWVEEPEMSIGDGDKVFVRGDSDPC